MPTVCQTLYIISNHYSCGYCYLSLEMEILAQRGSLILPALPRCEVVQLGFTDQVLFAVYFTTPGGLEREHVTFWMTIDIQGHVEESQEQIQSFMFLLPII